MQWLDPDFIFQTVLPALNRGLVMSIALIVPSATIGFVLGVLTGVARVFGPKWLRSLGNGFTTIFRGVPLVVQLMILYFGLPNLGIYLEPYPASVLGFILCTGAYQSEYVRGALLSIRQGQIKAAYALGFTKLQTILWVVIPQAALVAVPSLGNSFISLLKDTSLVSSITVAEILMTAKSIIAVKFQPLLLYCEAALVYLIFSTVLTQLQGMLEKKLGKHLVDTRV